MSISGTKIEKIVLIGKFCPLLQLPKCSHTSSMLRFCPFATLKIFTIISDFKSFCRQILPLAAATKMLTYLKYAPLFVPLQRSNFYKNHPIFSRYKSEFCTSKNTIQKTKKNKFVFYNDKFGLFLNIFY